ncbi:MAG TPA: hypothetical protein PLO04_08810, partial [Syntrophorhabdaceae bacterium]|nr:hypothetical protein [Syntrophorhabdaceae bacterium]
MERLCSNEMEAIMTSDKGRVMPFLLSDAASIADFCHKLESISIYGSSEIALRIMDFSLSDFIPCKSSKITI